MEKKSLPTPAEFMEKMQQAFGWSTSVEKGHTRADKLMCDLLEKLGYNEAVKVFREADKWYS